MIFSELRDDKVVGVFEGKVVVPKFKVLLGEEWLVRLRKGKDGYVAFKVEPNVAVEIGDDSTLKLRCGSRVVEVPAKLTSVASKKGWEVRLEGQHPRYGKHFAPIAFFTYADLLDPLKVLEIVEMSRKVPPPPNRAKFVTMAYYLCNNLITDFLPTLKYYLRQFLNGDLSWLEPLPELPPEPKIDQKGWRTRTYEFKDDIPPSAKIVGKTPSGAFEVKEPVLSISNQNEILRRKKEIFLWWANLNLVVKAAIYCIVRKREPLTLNELAKVLVGVECADPLNLLAQLKSAVSSNPLLTQRKNYLKITHEPFSVDGRVG